MPEPQKQAEQQKVLKPEEATESQAEVASTRAGTFDCMQHGCCIAMSLSQLHAAKCALHCEERTAPHQCGGVLFTLHHRILCYPVNVHMSPGQEVRALQFCQTPTDDNWPAGPASWVVPLGTAQ